VDRASFQRFYERSAPALRSYLRYTCRDAALADDLLQEAYLRMLRAGPAELDEAQRKSYLYRAAHSALADHFRRANRAQDWLDGNPEEATSWAGPKPAPPELPVDMQRVLDDLGTRDRQLLWLAYVEGFSHREIGPLLGVQEKSVRVLLTRARERIAALLTDRGLGPE